MNGTVEVLETLAGWCNEHGIGKAEYERRSATYAAVAELQRVAIFVSGRIFRWRTEGSAPSYREWIETEEMLDNALAALANVGGAK